MNPTETDNATEAHVPAPPTVPKRRPASKSRRRTSRAAPPKRQAARPAVEQFRGDAQPSELPEAEDGWDGTCTSVTLARTVMRDKALVAPGEKVIFRTCKSPTGEWIGPEAEHLQDLIKIGVIDATREKLARDSRQANIEYSRGVHAELIHDALGNVEQRPAPEFKERSHAEIQKLWKPVMAGGREGMMRREKQEARSEAASMKEVAHVLRQAMGLPLVELGK